MSSPRESDLRTAEAATWSAKKGASFTRAAENRAGARRKSGLMSWPTISWRSPGRAGTRNCCGSNSGN